MSPNIFYDISIWEEIRSVVSRKTDWLVESINQEIPKDASLAEFQGRHPVPFQLRQIMEQRAHAWVQRLYDICCDAYKNGGKILSADFNRAVWLYRIEPFIMGENDSQIHSGTMGGFLNLLLCAVGSPPERRRWLTVNQKECCFDVRREIYETWHDKLHDLPPRINEAIKAMAEANARERRAARIAAGLPPDDSTATPPTQAHPLRQSEELPPSISMADSSFWRDLANEFLKLQDRLRAENQATEFTSRRFNVLAKQGALAISGALDVWVWLGAAMKEDPEFRSSSFRKEVSSEVELGDTLAIGQIDTFCQSSAAFCTKLEEQAQQAEFKGNGATPSSITRPPMGARSELSSSKSPVSPLPLSVYPQVPTISEAADAAQRPADVTHTGSVDREAEFSRSGQSQPTCRYSGATKWQDVEIVFVSDFRVRIRIGSRQIEAQNYNELGFADGRNEKPNKAWETLRALAEQRGLLKDGSPIGDPWPKVEKRIQEIRKAFRELFGLSDDPLPFVGAGYQAVFKIRCSPSFPT